MINNIILSVEDRSNVIIGQELIVDVNFEYNVSIKKDAIITLENLVNIIAPTKTFSIGNEGGVSSIFLKLIIPKDLNHGDMISFDIVPNQGAIGFSQRNINYIAKDIDPISLSLKFIKKYVQTPEIDNHPPSQLNSKVMTTVKDKNQNSLSGIPVLISFFNTIDVDKVDIYAADQTTKIEVNKSNDMNEGFYVNSDKNGNIIFYVYPHKDTAAVLKFNSQVLNVTQAISSNELYIVTSKPRGNTGVLLLPIIQDLDGVDLISHGDFKFWINIPRYNIARPGDVIVFFVDNNYVGYNFTLKSTNDLGTNIIQLPYNIFVENQVSYISYTVISQNGNMYSSTELELIFKGGVPNKPDPEIERQYDLCKVYSSYGVYPGSIVEEYTYIYDDIISANNKEGLYVQITGTNDQNDTEHVTFGSEVTLNLYINSRQGHVTEHYTKRIPSVPDESGGNTATLTFNIPYDILKYNESYPDKPGEIYFDYQVGSDNDDVTYGKIWQAKIDTDMK
ncbi:hypothetical protein KKI90_08550 [Xenorhabdus bovienii]|uniref:hypothetical protein n=1 Tax=Xenorhabdus bovienii TaxID=40576 RepID=UPI00237C9A61|nr:hypothetical protein [Xenorhabdus bovienii]MDE1486314.1 hypothetical protein [Xenorhabdus bovienii]MDE9477116.1 hypothetical protein [Xenorhabdus bovienii]MDE9529984.1 hypothetical protein [Xenorhabdus bovienii]